jgi:Pyruvate/2-oxoacid:ferredoxin oxidoreductase delta subunit
LNGEDLKTGREEEIEETTWVKDWEKITKKPERYTAPHMDMGKQKVSFEEAEEFLTKIKETAMFEARRCLECGPCSECLESEGLCEVDKAVVDEALCTGCNVCAGVCPTGAIKKNELGVAQVDEDLCKGCGTCSASCPERAIFMRRLTDAQIIGQVASALGGGV